MDRSESSRRVNMVDSELMRPGTSKQVYKTDNTNQNEVSADLEKIEDEEDDEDIVYNLCLDVSSESLVNDYDDGGVLFTEESRTRVNTLSCADVVKLQDTVSKSAGLRSLFRNHLMEPLTFLLLLHDFGLELKLTRLIEDCGGIVYNSVNDVDGYTIVMVKDESLHWSYLGVVFKVSYIQACVDLKKILDITRFYKSSVKLKLKDNFNFMSVVYFKKYAWDSIPEKYIVPKKQPLSPLNRPWSGRKNPIANSALNDGDVTVLSDEDVDDRVKMPPPETKRLNKHTRMLYSRKEDEDILKYIIKKEGYNSLKGNAFWKNMESRNICPSRTWQSVKEHFIKKIIYNLNSFSFLTEKQITLLQVSVLQK